MPYFSTNFFACVPFSGSGSAEQNYSHNGNLQIDKDDIAVYTLNSGKFENQF